MHWNSFWLLATLVTYAAVALAIVHILRARRDPRGMLAWILALLLLPILGLMLYLVVGRAPMERKIKRRRKRRQRIEPRLSQQMSMLESGFSYRGTTEADMKSAAPLIKIATRVSDSIVTRGNHVAIVYEGKRAFDDICSAIEGAKSHVHVMYYIYANDATGNAMSDLLIRRARDGIEVRLLLDAVGCWLLPKRHLRRLKAGGVKVAFFMPWALTRRRVQLNCRNHRKLCVVDGRIAFSGSGNIGDEYTGRSTKVAALRDTYLTLRGPCVSQMQEVFAEDWHFATQDELVSESYFPNPTEEGTHAVQIVASGPDDSAHVMHQLLYAAVADATECIEIITPYFVPDQAILLALTSAAYRDVRVRILIPSRTDHKIVLWAGRTFYPELLRAGVEIFEYEHTLLHSKTAAIDGRWAMVGSANMDIRSFRLNYELTTLLYDSRLAESIHKDFDALVKKSRGMSARETANWSLGQQIMAGAARLMSPLL